MKKITSIILVLTLMLSALVLASCGEKETYSITHSADTIKGNIATIGASTGYSITLRFTSDGVSEDLTFAKKGPLYYVNDRAGNETYYDLGTDAMITYTKAAGAAEWTVKTDKYNEYYTKILARDTLDSMMTDYSNYLVYYAIKDLGTRTGFTFCKDEQINGRDCKKYEKTVEYGGEGADYTYWIDADGICVKYTIEASSGDKTSTFSVECYEYKTPYEITLPTVAQ